ncbi:MAG: hypothetical protein JWQ98_1070 [Chlorobi bacterium]|nr:hypothetical protein [Chlorobiota bacterium]
MSRVGIRQGDVLSIDAAMEPKPGEIVYARTGSAGLVTQQWAPPFLLSLNDDATPTRMTPEMNVQVLGVVVSMIRDLTL